MTVLLPLSDWLTYLLFSLLAGYVFLAYIPEEKKPAVVVPRQLMLTAPLGIALLSFMPVLNLIITFGGSIGYVQSMYSVIFEFQAGRAWMMIAWLSIFVWLTVFLKAPKAVKTIGLLLLVFAIGYASHAASLAVLTGMLSHAVHYLTVGIWTGILLLAGWFSFNSSNWHAFLKWFHPFALGVMALIIGSGVAVMLFVLDFNTYINSWVLPYGQLLLLKHVSILPLLAFAFINGYLARKALKDKSFNPLPWVKAETFMISIVFFITGIMSTKAPPHNVDVTARTEGISSWYQFFHPGMTEPPVNLAVTANIQGILLLFCGLILLMLILLSFRKNVHPAAAVFFALLFIISTYAGTMLSVM
ncbi:hypothetical protein GJU40_05040 [Bacillus lacus]|uniref:Copper resistance protein D domain-containing protein n=1 Tax=Metabacillus lacus TaxID=1983721 RepID=A0A7X2LWJ3_9BACI|nr:CopD family protein [Metabacillus lacus]MRX71540.1 hypothetical protein [Metabacillus lacus]